MFLAESAGYPKLARLAQSAYDALADGGEAPHWILSDMIGEASRQGVLRVMHRKYSATAYDALLMPICREIDRQRPVPPARALPRRKTRSPAAPSVPSPRQVTAPAW